MSHDQDRPTAAILEVPGLYGMVHAPMALTATVRTVSSIDPGTCCA